MTVIARLAPSPTGALHLGNARSFLIAWLSARSQNGRVILRIEDIDSPRVKSDSVQQIFDDFRWLGLDWDDGPIVQTHRLPLYREALDDLKRRELVYPCVCTRGDIERAASAPHLEHEGPIYPGSCRHHTASRSFDGPTAWRLRTDESRVTWDDGFRGSQSFALHEIGGDFVVWKSADTPAYQLAVVVDDAAIDVTEVVRGDDLVSSTPRQLLLYRHFGWTPPRFFHVPLVVGSDGRRLAKRHGDTRVSTYRERGMTAEEMLGRLAASCGWVAKGTKLTARELIGMFRWDTIPRRAIALDEV